MTIFIAIASLLSLILGHDEAEIVFAGDAMMHTLQIEVSKQKDGGYDFSECFAEIDSYIRSADYAVVNLETPVSQPPYSGYPRFNAPATYLDALKDAGFDLFLTANNHTLDRADEGLCNTIDSLEARHLDHIGTYKSDSARHATVPFIRNINGIKIGFLNYTYGTNGLLPKTDVKVDYINREQIRRDVEATRNAGAEYIFACIHWGDEYKLLPNKVQCELGLFLHEIGVDAVIGSHPHVIQPIELKDGRLTVYSLGNFISNMLTRDTRGGALVRVVVKRDTHGNVRLADASYRLVFTEPPSGNHNFRLQWVDKSSDYRAKLFAQSARAIFRQHNIGISEDLSEQSHPLTVLFRFAAVLAGYPCDDNHFNF